MRCLRHLGYEQPEKLVLVQRMLLSSEMRVGRQVVGEVQMDSGMRWEEPRTLRRPCSSFS